MSRAIDAWVDSELDHRSARRVAAHAGDCWDCSSAAETTRLIKRALATHRDRQPRDLGTTRLLRFAEQLTHA